MKKEKLEKIINIGIDLFVNIFEEAREKGYSINESKMLAIVILDRAGYKEYFIKTLMSKVDNHLI